MKFTFPFLFVLCCLLAFSCSDDEETRRDADLNYDTENFSAPQFTDVTFEAGARFPALLTSNFVGQQLTEVEFYIMEVPSSTELLIYGPGSPSTPAGTPLYQVNLTTDVGANRWNSHVLSTPVDITGEDLWINVRVTHNGDVQSVGCDEGPATQNGDWISLDNGGWRTLRNFSNDEVNINWNIRGFVE